MKVKELIEKLEKMDQELEVEIQVEEMGDRYFTDNLTIGEVFYSYRDNRYCLLEVK